VYGHLQVLSTIFCEEISISSFVREGERDLTLQCMGCIGLMSGVLGALPGLGLLLSVRGVLHMGGACGIVIYINLYYLARNNTQDPYNYSLIVGKY